MTQFVYVSISQNNLTIKDKDVEFIFKVQSFEVRNGNLK